MLVGLPGWRDAPLDWRGSAPICTRSIRSAHHRKEEIMHFRDCLAVLAALASATLAPVAAADEAAAERNLDKLNLPPGFKMPF